MDSAYDHIQEESYPQDPTKQGADGTTSQTASNFNAEIQDAYKAISSSPWAARLGGFLGTVKKQGEQYYDTASKQYAATSKNATSAATSGVSTLMKHARNLSIQGGEPSIAVSDSADKDTPKEADPDAHPDRPESLPADIVKEAGSVLARFRSEAAKRLKDIEKAEDAADEALLKFGTNIRSFLADAVSIAPPESGSENEKNGTVLFESKDASGKKVVHATRFDAQLHVIHSTLDSFLKDPVSPEWEKWRKDFDVEKKTDDIAKDLEKHTELRTAMEKCVPEKVEYASFWERYYFLRHVIESEEQRRREMLKASNPADDEEVAWDEDSDEESDEEESDKNKKPQEATKSPATSPATSPAKAPAKTPAKPPIKEESDEDSDEEEDSSEEESSDEEDSSDESPNKSATNLAASRETLKPTAAGAAAASKLAAKSDASKPAQPRRSNDEKSVASSDASYDVVSGTTSRAPSRAPGSPPQDKKKAIAEESDEESDEEDWE